MDYALRVTKGDDVDVKLTGFCRKYFDEYLIVYEDPDADCHNEHYHVHGYTTANKGTLQQALKRLFPNKYSLKEADERNIQYICKGAGPDEDQQPIIVDYKGSQFEYDWHRAYWDEFVAKNGDFDPNFKKRKRLTSSALIDEVISHLADKHFDYKDKNRVLMLMWEVWQSHGQVLNTYQARSYYYELAYKLSEDEDAKFALADSLTSKW